VKNNNTLPDGAVSRAIILAVAITVGGIFAMWVLFKVMKAVLYAPLRFAPPRGLRSLRIARAASRGRMRQVRPEMLTVLVGQ
jgi:hypothetical protein